jgi:phage gpG-like protein
MASKITYRDNSDEFKNAFEQAKHRGLEAIGLTAEGFAKKRITEAGAVDTGRLRNSITYAVAGYPTHVQSYRQDNVSGGTTQKHQRYSYGNETMSGEKDSAVYIGTNVEYAAGIELGTHRKAGAVHFLQDAATGHSDKYKRLMEDSMKNA